MIWNRPRAETPPFTWDGNKVLRAEWLFLSETGSAIGMAKHLPPQEQSDLVVDSLVRDALATVELEGEVLEPARVRACIRSRMGLAFDDGGARGLEAGVAALIVDVVQNPSKPLTGKTLAGWRNLVTEGASSDTGRAEMRKLVRWLGRESANDDIETSPLVYAGLSHLWLESAHPCSFGTGILGRAVAQRTILRGVPNPNYTPMAQVMLRRQKEYFAAIDNACRDRDATSWLAWFASAAIEAVRENAARVEFIKRKIALLDSLRDRICGRQEDVLRHLFANETEAFDTGIGAGAYSGLTGANAETAQADLTELLALGALKRDEQGSSGVYRLNLPPPTVKTVRVEDVL